VPDWEQNSAYFGASKFTYDAEQDHYICPNAQVLRPTYLSKDGQRVLYRAKATSCRTCPLRAQCTPSTTAGRSVWRSVGHEYIERVQTYQSTAAYQKAVRKRQVWVEPLFAEGKQWHQMRRFRLRRLWRVNTEAFLVAAGQNPQAPAAETRLGPQTVSWRNGERHRRTWCRWLLFFASFRWGRATVDAGH
jgi:hypothetical protein